MANNSFASEFIQKHILARLAGGTGKMDSIRPTYIGLSGERFQSADQSAAAAAVIDAPPNGEHAVITDIILSVDTAITVTFTDEVGGDEILVLYMPENSVIQLTPLGSWELPSANSRLMVQTSAAGNISVTAFYKTEH